MNSLATQNPSKESESQKPTGRRRRRQIIDSGLRLFFSPEKTQKICRTLYRYRWRNVGVAIGSLLMTILMQAEVKAQIANTAETEITNIFGPFLTAAGATTDSIALFFGSGRFIFFVFGFGLAAYGLYDAITNRGSNWHIWGGIGIAMILAVIFVSLIEDLVF